jgi:hypothetical protein
VFLLASCKEKEKQKSFTGKFNQVKEIQTNEKEGEQKPFHRLLHEVLIHFIREDHRKHEKRRPSISNLLVRQETPKAIYCLYVWSRHGDRYVGIRAQHYYYTEDNMYIYFSEKKDDIQRKSPIVGYTFLEGELVICYCAPDTDTRTLVHEELLTPFVDTIPMYRKATPADDPGCADGMVITYKITNNDSLIFVQ